MTSKQSVQSLTIRHCECEEHDKPHWEIEDPNNPDCPLVGPYDTKAEAEEAKRGLTKFYKKENK